MRTFYITQIRHPSNWWDYVIVVFEPDKPAGKECGFASRLAEAVCLVSTVINPFDTCVVSPLKADRSRYEVPSAPWAELVAVSTAAESDLVAQSSAQVSR